MAPRGSRERAPQGRPSCPEEPVASVTSPSPKGPPAPRTAGEVLERSRRFLEQRALPAARREAELLVAHALGLERLGLYR